MTNQAATVRDNLVKILTDEIAEQARVLDGMRACLHRLEGADVTAHDAESQIIAIANDVYKTVERAI